MGDNSTLTSEEKRGVEQIRAALGDKLPPPQNTDFHLRRWLKAYSGQIDTIKQKYEAYLESYYLLGFDRSEFMTNFREHPIIAKVGPYVSQTAECGAVINQRDNGIVFVDKIFQQPNELVKALSSTDYLMFTFLHSELMQQHLLQHEQLTGKPAHGLCIYDLQGGRLTQYANPMAAIHRLLNAGVHLWQEYYAEAVSKIVIINAPTFLSAIWSITKLVVPERLQGRFTFAKRKENLAEHFDRNAIPVAYGGDWAPPDGSGLESNCCNKQPDKFVEYDRSKMWADLGVSECPPLQTTHVAHGLSVKFDAERANSDVVGRKVVWQYFAHGAMEFSVWGQRTKEEGKEPEQKLLFPRLLLASARVCEEGSVDCSEEFDSYYLQFHNFGHFFSVKLDYVVRVV